METCRVNNRGVGMEANIALGSRNQTQAYNGKKIVRRLKNIFLIKDLVFLEGVQQMYGVEYLEDLWKRHLNLDVVSLFVALALMVSDSKEEVSRVVTTCVDPQWLMEFEEIVARVVLGVGIETGVEPWRLIGGEDSSIQPLVIWSSASPKGVHVPKGKQGWRKIVESL